MGMTSNKASTIRLQGTTDFYSPPKSTPVSTYPVLFGIDEYGTKMRLALTLARPIHRFWTSHDFQIPQGTTHTFTTTSPVPEWITNGKLCSSRYSFTSWLIFGLAVWAALFATGSDIVAPLLSVAVLFVVSITLVLVNLHARWADAALRRRFLTEPTA